MSKTAMDSWLKAQALKQPKTPIKYWEVWIGGRLIDQNVSIALLKYKYGKQYTYKPKR